MFRTLTAAGLSNKGMWYNTIAFLGKSCLAGVFSNNLPKCLELYRPLQPNVSPPIVHFFQLSAAAISKGGFCPEQTLNHEKYGNDSKRLGPVTICTEKSSDLLVKFCLFT